MSVTGSRWSSPRPTPRRRTPPKRSMSPTTSCRPWSISPMRTMPSTLVHDEVASNLIYDWELGDKAAVDAAMASAAHVTRIDLVNNRLVPNAMEPRAAVGTYDSGLDQYTCYVTSQNPHVHRLVMSAFIQVAPEHKLRVIGPDVGGGFGSKIFIYGEECVVTWASKKVGGRPVKWVADRSESFLSDCHGRDHISHAELALDADGNMLALERPHQGQSRRLHVDLQLVRADLSLRHAARRPVQDAGDLRQCRGLLHQHGPGGRLSRRRPARGVLPDRDADRSGGAGKPAAIRPSSAARTSSPTMPSPTRRRSR